MEKYQELGVPGLPPPLSPAELETQTRQLAAAAMIDMGVFFAVLLVGFAYLWKRGDLDWVRAVKGFGVQGSGFRTPGEDYPPNTESEFLMLSPEP